MGFGISIYGYLKWGVGVLHDEKSIAYQNFCPGKGGFLPERGRFFKMIPAFGCRPPSSLAHTLMGFGRKILEDGV